jgi:hypothetical protein
MKARILVGAFALAACSPSPEQVPTPLPPLVAFESDPQLEGPSLSLEAGVASGSTLPLELVARDIDDVYGLAFRLTYAPDVLRFSKLDHGSAFGSDVLVVAKEARPGLLLGAVTKKGARTGLSGLETTLAVMSFEVLRAESSAVNFDAARTRVFASSGISVPLRVTGGQLAVE